MSQYNFVLNDALRIRAAIAGSHGRKAKAVAKMAARRQERHQGKSLLALELQLLPGELRYQKAVQAALDVIADFEVKKLARKLAATRGQFREFAKRQCIPLISLAEMNAKTVWEPDPKRKAFKAMNSAGREITLASCAL